MGQFVGNDRFKFIRAQLVQGPDGKQDQRFQVAEYHRYFGNGGSGDADCFLESQFGLQYIKRMVSWKYNGSTCSAHMVDIHQPACHPDREDDHTRKPKCHKEWMVVIQEPVPAVCPACLGKTCLFIDATGKCKWGKCCPRRQVSAMVVKNKCADR